MTKIAFYIETLKNGVPGVVYSRPELSPWPCATCKPNVTEPLGTAFSTLEEAEYCAKLLDVPYPGITYKISNLPV